MTKNTQLLFCLSSAILIDKQDKHQTMKAIVLILALIAATAYAAPIEEDAKIEAFIEKLLASEQQDDGIQALLEKATERESEHEEVIQSLLAQMQDDEDEDAFMEAYFAQEQAAEIQGWFKKIWGRIKQLLGKKCESTSKPLLGR